MSSTQALDLLYQAMCMVQYRYLCIAMASKMAGKEVRVFFIIIVSSVSVVVVATREIWTYGASSHRQIMAVSRGAFGVALLDMLHWTMPSVLYHCTAMAIKIASKGDALFCIILDIDF